MRWKIKKIHIPISFCDYFFFRKNHIIVSNNFKRSLVHQNITNIIYENSKIFWIVSLFISSYGNVFHNKRQTDKNKTLRYGSIFILQEVFYYFTKQLVTVVILTNHLLTEVKYLYLYGNLYNYNECHTNFNNNSYFFSIH